MKKTVFLMILVMTVTALCCGAAMAATIPITETTTTWTDGNTYLAIGDVTISERIQVQGTVTLSLESEATLNVKNGIHVSEGNSLTIEGNGTLNATGGNNQAGIGGDKGEAAGAITINSGTVTVHGGQRGAGDRKSVV